ncbi:MAG: PRC-barrel domain containing protein [Bradyrhizobium sp.]|nr:PRC-barrel domain containing protein [Bradyrhizobium sp.]
MIVKYAIAGMAGTALLASAAFAQSPSTPSDTTRNSPTTTMSSTSSTAPSSFHGNWRASKLVGLSVYNEKNESVGSINDMLTDKDGKIVAVVIGVGGFLGVGEHLVAVPFDKVKFSTEPVVYTGAANAPASGAGSTTRPGTTTGAATTAPAASKPNPWWPDHAIFNATKEELKAMPEFKYST